MNSSKKYNFQFVQGEIPTQELSNQLKSFSDLYEAGAYSIFLGQVRKDKIENKLVESIDYTANEEMAKEQFTKMLSETCNLHAIERVSIVHSLGIVKSGGLCLMVIVACGHRKQSFVACEYIVERLKKEVPIWGKELFEDQSHQWKVNKF